MRHLLLIMLLSPSLALPASVQVTGGYLRTQTVFPIPTAQMTIIPAVTPDQAYAMTMCNNSMFTAPSINDPMYEIVGVVGRAVTAVTVVRALGGTTAKRAYNYMDMRAYAGTDVIFTLTPTPTHTPTFTPTATFTPTQTPTSTAGNQNMTFLNRVAAGLVPGTSQWDINGWLPAVVGKDSINAVWAVGGPYIYPAAEQAMVVVSSNAADSSAGAGIRSVIVDYLDDDNAQKATTVTLNGTTPVTCAVADMFRINNFRAYSWGASLSAVGSVDIKNAASTVVYSRIAPQFNRADNGCKRVPAGYTCYVLACSYWAGYTTSGKTVRIEFRANYNNLIHSVTSVGAFFDYSRGLFMDNGVPYDFPIWYEIPAGTDIQLNAIGEADTQVSASLRCILKDNNTLWADLMHDSWKWIVRSCFGTISSVSELSWIPQVERCVDA